MYLQGVRTAIAAGIVLVAVQPVLAAEWWMVHRTEEGAQCGPPLEADGVVLTPDEILKRFEECKLMDETPSLDLKKSPRSRRSRAPFSAQPVMRLLRLDRLAASSGMYVRGSASWDGVGASDYSGYTLQGTVNVPLN